MCYLLPGRQRSREQVIRPQSSAQMNNLRKTAVPVYVIAAFLILSTALDLLQAAWPPQVGWVNWRVLVVGALARMLAVPLLGLVLAFGAALMLEQARALRFLAGLNAVLAGLLLVGLVFYALDVFQLRAQVIDQNRSMYDVGIVVSFAKYGLGFVALLALAWAERKAATVLRAATAAPEPEAMLVRRRAESAGAPDDERGPPAQ